MERTRLEVFCDRLIEACWLAALVVVPLLFNVYSSRVFEPDKITTLRSIALVMAGAWLVKQIDLWFYASRTPADSGEGPRGSWKQVFHTPLVLPMLILVLVYILSTVFSVVPRVSLLGSYQRLQGTYSLLSYVVVFVMMLQGIRTREQVERLITVVILTSVPVALYGIIQHYGLDPLPWGGDVRSRVAGHMGNSIFIAAYLIMSLPLALYRTVESFTEILTADKSRFVDIFLGASYVFIVAIQLICIFFTQSRGPWLGLIGGLFFFFLELAVVRRWRWLVWGSVVSVLSIATFLVVFNWPNSPLASLRSMPYVGRLGSALDKEQGTSKVRLLIWEGAIDMILPHPPLERPDGARDWMNPLRPVIGYGPESMYVAYNRFYPPDLAHYEARNASPDRSHNETFDSLVITGVAGFAAYMFFFAAVFYYGFRWLGIIARAAERYFFFACWIVGGAAGALLMVLWQGPQFFGVGLPAGIAVGLGLYLVVWGLWLSQRGGKESVVETGHDPYRLLIVALVAAILAHFVEVHFGIAIAATRTYFWAYVGLIVVVGYLIPRRMAREQESAMPVLETSLSRTRSRRRAKRPGSAQPADEALPGLRAVLPCALVLTLILSTLVFNFVSNNQLGLDSPSDILSVSLIRRVVNREPVPSYGVPAVVGITWLLGSAIIVAEWIRRGGQGNWRVPFWVCLSTSLLVAFFFAMIMAGRLAGTQTQLLEQMRRIMGMLTTYYIWLFGLILAATLALVAAKRLPRLLWHPISLWTAPVVMVAVVVLILVSNVRVIQADMIYKQAESYERSGHWDLSIVLHQEAIKRARQEDLYYLFLGRACLERARSAQPAERELQVFSISELIRLKPEQVMNLSREELLGCSESTLLEARRINPLNTDHSANLGRLYRTRAEMASDPAERSTLYHQSLARYAEAVSLSPHAAHLFWEWGQTWASMGDLEQAVAKYEQALAIDELFINTHLSLGDAYMQMQEMEKAKAQYLRAVGIDPRVPEVHSVLAYIYGMEKDYTAAISETLQVLELSADTQQQYLSYRNLAVYYQQLNMMPEAMRAAQEALARAPENERAGLQAWIAQMTQGGVAPETEVLVQQYLAEGEAALNNQLWAAAEQAYKQALALNPTQVAAHSALSYIYAQQGRLQEAESENLIVLAAIPGDLATLKNLAIIYRELKQYDKAIEYAQLAIESAQATPEDKELLQLFITEIDKLRDSE